MAVSELDDVVIFDRPEDEPAYQKWLLRNFHGFVLNHASDGWIIHGTSCDHVQVENHDVITGPNNPKWCSLNKRKLVHLARERGGNRPRNCPTCAP